MVLFTGLDNSVGAASGLPVCRELAESSAAHPAPTGGPRRGDGAGRAGNALTRLPFWAHRERHPIPKQRERECKALVKE